MRERWGYYWRMLSLLMTALHTDSIFATSSNSCDHSHYKSIIPSLPWIPFIPLLNLHQTAHPNLPPPFTSRCPSMIVSIIEIVLSTKLTAEHQYLLRSSSHPLQNIRAFPFSLALRIRRICFFNETHNLSLLNQEPCGVFILSHTLTQATLPDVSL